MAAKSLAGMSWRAVLARGAAALAPAPGKVADPVLAGTDAAPIFPENTAGFSLREEVIWFVASDMNPVAALQTATLNPAIYSRATDSLGTVAVGKVADLVVLEADPLVDIRNVTKIATAIANGRYFDRAQLDRVLADVEHRGQGRSAIPMP